MVMNTNALHAPILPATGALLCLSFAANCSIFYEFNRRITMEGNDTGYNAGNGRTIE